MAIAWLLNGETLASLGLKAVSGTFRTQGVSSMVLERVSDFDATELLAYGTSATLTRDGVKFFQGKIDSIPKHGSDQEEGQIYEIVDAWADLETTIYQEQWGVGAGTVMIPKFVMGLGLIGAVWTRLNVGQQIGLILDHAIAQGVNLQKGSIPTGELLTPSEEANLSCAEGIMMCLKLHPDWIPWIDHSTTPPTFHVTPVSSMSAVSLPVNGTGAVDSFECIKRSDLIPSAVRIVYEFATTIGDEVFRNTSIDKYPALGPDGGPRVMQATIPLAGMQMQIQKSRIQTRTIPTGPSATGVKAWIKAKYPHLADVAEGDFDVNSLTRALVVDTDTHPEPISPQAERLVASSLPDVPRELVRGTIEDWMRRKVGKVRISLSISAAAGASAASKKAIAKGTPTVTVVATDAVTKIYKGVSQWVAPEDVPTGLAAAVYNAILAGVVYQGNASLTEVDVGSVQYHGRKIHLTGGVAAWGTMGAPVHTVDFDVETGKTTIGFGPPPQLAPVDFLELQRILRARETRWWSFAERGSNALGAEADPSAAGDSVSGYEIPETIIGAPDSAGVIPFQIYDLRSVSGTWKAKVKKGFVQSFDPTSGTEVMITPTNVDADITVTSSSQLYCKVLTNKQDKPTSAEILTISSPVNVHAQSDPSGADGTYYYKIADFQTVGDEVAVKDVFHAGGCIIHRPGRNDRNLKITISPVEIDTNGNLVSAGTDNFLFFRQGLYIGTTDPADSATQDELEINNIIGA